MNRMPKCSHKLGDNKEDICFSGTIDGDSPYVSNLQQSLKPLKEIVSSLLLNGFCRTILKGSEHFSILRHNKNGLMLQYIERVDNLTVDYSTTFNEVEHKQLKEIIKQNVKPFNFDELKPIYATKVKELIEMKANGKEIKVLEVNTERMESSNLLDTLKIMNKEKPVIVK